eukprot:COSAG02_NODE_5275_length_4478_cov_2.390728_4_plen_75_part_00
MKKNPDGGLPHEDQRHYISDEEYELESMGMQDKAVCARMRKFFLSERGLDFEAEARCHYARMVGIAEKGANARL